MPSYSLTRTQLRMLTTWLFAPGGGYLNLAFNASGVSARQALEADSGLDVTAWIRANTKAPETLQVVWDECSMVWWIRVHDQVNVAVPQRPPEAAQWAAILHEWDASIDAGFSRSPQVNRNNKSWATYDENGLVEGSIPSGAQLAQQQLMISQVLTVLE